VKIVLIGAGSAQFGLGTLGDFFQSKMLYHSEIVLVDINEGALTSVLEKAQRFLDEHQLPFTVSATTDRTEALKNADVVAISIEVGSRFELWDMDWTIAHQYGIKQIYGENGGAGGIFHALRITPVILAICKDIVELSPDAWVFNFSNPMTAITTTVLRKYPELKFIGLCHEVASLERYLPHILNTPFEHLELRSGGLNHFSVLLQARYKESQKDAYPDILEKAPAFFEREMGYSDMLYHVRKTGEIPRTEGEVDRAQLLHERSITSWADRRLFKLILENYRLLPITSDSHLGEYISWAYEVVDHKGILDFYSLYQLQLSQERSGISLEREERLVLILEGILSDSGYEEPAVNVMNHNLIPHLVQDIAVEVPAIISAKGVTPIALPEMDRGFAALLNTYSGVYSLTSEAVLTGKKEYVIQALLTSPIIHQYRGLHELVDVMIERQAPHLDYLR
jgi:alpha-galactosidase